MAVPICPLCQSRMAFKWEPFIHDQSIRNFMKAGLGFAIVAVVREGWADRSAISMTELLLVWIVVVGLNRFAVGGRPTF